MAISIKHAFASAKGDGSDATFVQPSHWNQPHATVMAAGNLLGRLSPGAGVFEEIPISAYMAGLLATADYNALAAKLGLFSPGDLKFSIAQTVPAGWLLYQASWTIGKTGSGATYADDSYYPLYSVIYANIVDGYAPVSGGRSGVALNDFNAGKVITLPQFGGRAIFPAGSTPNATARAIGQWGGFETHTLTVAELASHRHTAALYNPGHYHGYTAGGGGMGVGGEGVDRTAGAPGFAANSGQAVWNADPYGLRVYSNDAGMDTTYLAGSSGAHNNMSPYITMWLHIKL